MITRAAGVFDRLVVGVVADPQHKGPMFSLDERVDFLRGALPSWTTSRWTSSPSSSSTSPATGSAKAIVKGLRVISDFEWEFQMNQLNRHARAGDRDRLRDGEPAVQLRVLERREGDRLLRRKCGRIRARTVARRFAELFPTAAPGAPVTHRS